MTAQREYPFTPADFAAAFQLDEATGSLTWRHRPDQGQRWNSRWAGTPALATPNAYGYLRGKLCGHGVMAHRAVFAMVHGRVPCGLIDHIDGNRKNNRPDNLREASHSQNQMNTKPRGGTSRFKGVSWHQRSQAWQVHIKINAKPRNLGRFVSEIEAAKAYDAEAVRLFGEFAVLNFGGSVNA